MSRKKRKRIRKQELSSIDQGQQDKRDMQMVFEQQKENQYNNQNRQDKTELIDKKRKEQIQKTKELPALKYYFSNFNIDNKQKEQNINKLKRENTFPDFFENRNYLNSEKNQQDDLNNIKNSKESEQPNKKIQIVERKVNTMARFAAITRTTKETDISLDFSLDGTGKAEIDTGIGFFDHMLTSFAKHGFFDLKLNVKGDLYVDGHHTVEDTGIVLGQAIRRALGDKVGIKRYGSFLLPMDEALVMCAVDLSGRPFLNFSAVFGAERVGYFDTELVREFFYAVSYNAGMNLHIKQIDGENSHHIIEAMFKAFAKALDMAVSEDTRIVGALSTKGTIV